MRPQGWIPASCWLGVVSSTQEAARGWVAAGGQVPALIAADWQSQGRGRWGRPWVAPAGKALLFTLATEWPPWPVWWLLGSAVAWAETLEAATGLPVRVKWPNDLLLEGRKVGGGLLEEAKAPSGQRIALLGWGINVNLRREDFPAEWRSQATSLQEATGRPWSREALLEDFLGRLYPIFLKVQRGERESLRRAWLERSETVGRWVRVRLGSQEWEGEAVDLSPEGALILATSQGAFPLPAGEVLSLP